MVLKTINISPYVTLIPEYVTLNLLLEVRECLSSMQQMW